MIRLLYNYYYNCLLIVDIDVLQILDLFEKKKTLSFTFCV